MKRKQILARAITLGLLLAMPCGAWAETLSGDATYEAGLSVNSGATLDGTEESRYNVTVDGTVENDKYGVVNQGTIQNIGTLTVESIKNQGKLEAENLNTKNGSFLNDGENAIATISGGNINQDITNNNKACLNIKGDVMTSSSASFVENFNGAVMNIDSGVTLTVNGHFQNGYKQYMQQSIEGGTINAEGANIVLSNEYSTFMNTGNANIGSLTINGRQTSTNRGTLIINGSVNVNAGALNNSGQFIYNGDKEIKGSVSNTGTLFVTQDNLKVTGTFSLTGSKAIIAKNATETLNRLTAGLSVHVKDKALLNIKEQITAPFELWVRNGGQVKTKLLEVGSLNNEIVNTSNYQECRVEADNLVFSKKITNGEINMQPGNSSGTIVIHDSIEYNGDSSGEIDNYGKIIFDRTQATIGSNIIVNNKEYHNNNMAYNGFIAKTADGDQITNLTIEGTLNNSGVVAAETLKVANGADAADSKGFNVDNLNILDGGSFALNNAEYELQNVGVGAKATLTATGAVNDVQSVALADSATFETKSLAMADSGVVTSDGGSLTTNAMSGKGLTFNLQSDKERQINVKDFSGSDLTINVASLTPAQVVIDKMDGSGVTINGNSDITDSFESDNIEAGLQSLAYTASINKQSGDQSRKVASAAGKILGPTEAMTDAKNNIIKSSVKEEVNPANQGISEMASIALMTWRQENNDMNKRLGELRDSVGEHGVWVRMTRGEAKYGNQNIKNQYNAYQLGYDEKLSVDKRWTVGAALTYTDAESSFSYGKGENKHKGLAIYGSRLNDDGSFIDLIARYARLEHEYEVYGGAGKGDFDTNGYSLSAEYGKRFTQENGLWIEPQVELTYGRVSSGEYLTNNGVRVRQECMDSVVGRLGFALGKNLAQGKGNVYLRASYLYDFDGETDVRYSYGIQNKRFEQDLGGGWWEVGVGTNINLSEVAHLYFDVEKTYGGDVATPWQWNAGVRWSF